MSDPGSEAARRMDKMGEHLRAATPIARAEQDAIGRAKLVASVEAMRRPSRVKPVVAVLALAAAILLFVRGRGDAPAIAWHVESGAASAQGYVSASDASKEAHVVFDDGSDVRLAAGSRGRIAGTTSTGAELVLEEGRAHVHVRHRDRTRWMVDAGPFTVHVTGTEFLVAWAPETATLDVWMASGRVEITGPSLGDAMALSTGQHLRTHLPEGTVLIDGAPEPTEAATPDPINPPPVPTSTAVVAPSVEVTSPWPVPAASAPTWSKLVAAGDYARVVREADAEGFDHALGSRSLGDLRALGDAARYAGNTTLAKRVYATVRSRFARTSDARTAAFLLARIAEEQDHANADAARWYDTYLTEAPAGPFAGDALGRKMALVSKSAGREAARPLATSYLQRFPDGPYAAAARDLSR